MPSLIIRAPGGTLQTVPLADQPLTLGRSETCDVQLPSDEISREHAQVWVDESGRILVCDHRSKNGTRVDGGPPFHNATRAAFRTIHIGEYELEIVGASAPRDGDTARYQPDSPAAAGQTNFFPSSRGLDLNEQRLGLLMSLTERIGGAFERKQLMEQALDACCDALNFERGLIALRSQRGETEHPVTRNIQRDETGAYTVSRTLINRALVHGERAIVNNPAIDLVGNITESLVRYPICSALCVPIMHRDEILGVIYGDRVTQAATYSPADVDFLAAIARQVGVGIANLRLVARHVDMQKMVEELRQARTIQRRLLPGRPLNSGRVCLAGYNEPSSAVGGDYFDYFDLGPGRVGVIIADVTGHGLPAALMMANFQAAVHVALAAETPLPDLAQRLNRHVCRNTGSSVFITGIVGRIDTTTGIVEYINAGHPSPLLLGNGDIRTQEEGSSLPLGVEPDERFNVLSFGPDDGLEAALFFTDGLIEAPSNDGRQLDVDPVVNAIIGVSPPTADKLLETTLSVVRNHLSGAKNPDDLTLLALQYADRSAPVQ